MNKNPMYLLAIENKSTEQSITIKCPFVPRKYDVIYVGDQEKEFNGGNTYVEVIGCLIFPSSPAVSIFVQTVQNPTIK